MSLGATAEAACFEIIVTARQGDLYGLVDGSGQRVHVNRELWARQVVGVGVDKSLPFTILLLVLLKGNVQGKGVYTDYPVCWH